MVFNDMAISEMTTENTDSGFDLESYLTDLMANIGNIGHLFHLDKEKQSRIREALIKQNFT